MRNDDNSAAEGPPDNTPGAVYASEMPRRSRRRTQVVVGAVGLAAILSAGAYVGTRQLSDDTKTAGREIGAPAALATTPSPLTSLAPSSAAPRSSAKPSGSAKTAADKPRATPSTAAVQKPKTAAERIAAARAAGKKDGVEVQRALPPKNVAPIADKVTVTERGSIKKDRRTIRIVSARTDLTGQRELAWVADGGEPFGGGSCTQKIKLSNNTEARVRPTLLLCWRTSATRSVYTVAVDLDKAPSKADSFAAIDRVWATLS